jgi:hypothetical protein
LAITLPLDTGTRSASGASRRADAVQGAADVLQQMLPVDAGKDVETLRRHALKVGDVLRNGAATKPETAAQAITLTLDSTFIRSCEDDERHLEVRVGNVETEAGGRQVFGAAAACRCVG